MRIAADQATGSDTTMAHPLAAVSRLAPEILDAGSQFSAVTYAKSILPLRVFEGARARTAEINGCRICQGFRGARDLPRLYGEEVQTVASNGPAPDEEFYLSVSQWRTSPIYDERERVAIEYAEKMGLDPHGLAADEDFWARAKAAFSDAELVDLTWCIACWMGQGRALHVLGLDDVCALGTPDQMAAAASSR